MSQLARPPAVGFYIDSLLDKMDERITSDFAAIRFADNVYTIYD